MIASASKVKVIVSLNPFALGDREIYEADSGLLVDLIPDSLRDRARDEFVAVYEGKRIDPSEWDSFECLGGSLGFVAVPEGLGALGGAIWSAFQGAVFWYKVNIAIGYLVAAFVIGRIVMSMLMPKASDTAERGSTRSSVYSFSGISNTRTEGLPIPLVFGEIRFGGTIINEYLRSAGIPEVSTLFQEVSLGEGPIHSVSGVSIDTPAAQPLGSEFGNIPSTIHLDGNSAENYDDLQMWVRLGTNEQSVVPGFEATRVTFVANLGLTAQETGSDDNGGPNGAYVAASWSDTTNDAVWTEHGVALDLGLVPIDATILRLFFPRGLWKQDDTTGDLHGSAYAFQVRYRELTSGGVPITTGGYTSDGWVRTPPVGPITVKSSEPYTLEVPLEFYDPQTWTPPTPGNALKGEARSTASESETGFSVFFWFKAPVLPTDSAVPHSLLSIGEIELNSDGSITHLVDPSHPGITFEYKTTAPGLIVAGTWNHIALLAPRYAGGSQHPDPVALYINGGKRTHHSDHPGVGNLGFGAGLHTMGDLTNAPNTLFDQFVIYNHEFNTSSVLMEFNGGQGRETYFPFGWIATNSYAMSAVTFNDTGGAQDASAPGTPVFSSWAPFGVGSTSGVEPGVVPDASIPSVNDHKRSRYRIEVLRTNQDSINTRVADDVTFDAALAVTNSELTYPNTPILGIQAGATEQLNGSAPTTTSVVKGILVPVWDGASTASPAVEVKWSANPAWIALGLLTNGRWGMGHVYLIQDCVSQSLADWASYCDEIVYAGSAQYNYDTPTAITEDVHFIKLSTDPNDRGVITFNILVGSAPDPLPLDWVVGGFLRCHDFPVVGAGADINSGVIDTSDGGGYEIFGIQRLYLGGPGVDDYWTIKCHWDRLGETDPWTSNTYLSVAATITTAATIELGERRHEFNGVFDTEQGAWDSILEVCQVGRAIPIREGSKVRFKFQHPRSPIGLITSASIIKDSFSLGYSDGQMKPNAVDITILDKAQQYDLVPITVLDPAIENVLDLSEVRKVSRTYKGITSASQAERQARFELNLNRLLKRSGKFVLGPEGLPFEAGDLVRLGADLLPRGDGGRVLRASYSAAYKLEMLADPNDFTAWTAVGSPTVTANSALNPFGTATDADKVNDTSAVTHAYVEASGSVSGGDLNAEWLSVGVFVKPGTVSSNQSRIDLILDGGTSSWLVNWSADRITASPAATLDATLTASHLQKLGTSGWWFVQVAGFHESAGSGAAAPKVRIFPASNTSGEASATGDVELYGAHLSYGQWAGSGSGADPQTARVVMIDRDLTLLEGTNKLYTRNFRDGLSEGTVDSTLCPAGSYVAGDLLITTAGLAFAAQEETSWLVVKSGSELVVEIMSSELTQDMTRECEWIEYNAAIYNDVAGATSVSPLLGFGDNGLGIDYSVNENSLPGDTAITGAKDILVRQAPGQFVPTIYLGLAYQEATKPFISRTEIFWRLVQTDVADWALAGGTTGLANTAVVQLPSAQPGQTIEITAQSVTRLGKRRRPGTSLRVQVVLRGLGAPPETPTSVTAALSQRQAVYGFTLTSDDLLAVEIRRGGGWVLGQPVYREAASALAGARSSPPMANWAGSTTGSPTLRYAAQNAAGAYGVPATLSWSPSPDADSLPFDATAPDQAWEAWDPSNGWEAAVPAPGEPFIGPEFEQAADGSLGYTAASTSVAWETVYTTERDSGAVLTLEQDRQPRAEFLEAWLEADAVHHATWETATWEMGDLLEDRWTWEGPRFTTPGETANPQVRVEFRINVDGTTAGWGAWQTYEPGVYRIVDAQFRVRARRHDTGQDIILTKLHTRITPPRLALEESTPLHALIHREVF